METRGRSRAGGWGPAPFPYGLPTGPPCGAEPREPGRERLAGGPCDSPRRVLSAAKAPRPIQATPIRGDGRPGLLPREGRGTGAELPWGSAPPAEAAGGRLHFYSPRLKCLYPYRASLDFEIQRATNRIPVPLGLKGTFKRKKKNSLGPHVGSELGTAAASSSPACASRWCAQFGAAHAQGPPGCGPGRGGLEGRPGVGWEATSGVGGTLGVPQHPLSVPHPLLRGTADKGVLELGYPLPPPAANGVGGRFRTRRHRPHLLRGTACGAGARTVRSPPPNCVLLDCATAKWGGALASLGLWASEPTLAPRPPAVGGAEGRGGVPLSDEAPRVPAAGGWEVLPTRLSSGFFRPERRPPYFSS